MSDLDLNKLFVDAYGNVYEQGAHCNIFAGNINTFTQEEVEKIREHELSAG